VASLSSPAPLSFEKIIVSATELASDILDFLSYRSNILFAARTRLSKINPFVGEPTNPAINERSIDFFDEHFPSSLKKFRLNVETFIALTRVRGQTPILMTQPLGRSSYGQDIFNEEIRKAGSDNNVLVIDLDRALASDRQGLFLSDNIHLSNNGSIAVANVIVRDLARKLGSNVVKALPTGNLQHLSKTCLSAPEVGERFVAGPRHVLLDRHGRYPTFSADGKKLLFQTYQTGNERIQIYDIESEVYESLSDVGASYMDRHPTVISQTINGSFKIAYGSDRSGSERVYIMDWPSKTVEPLLEAYSLYGAIPARGPGQTVLFAGFSHKLQPAEHGIPDLFMYDLGNKQLRQLTETKEEEWRPVVSHDGKFVYYISNYHGDFDIFRKSLAGSKVQLVYRSKADEWDPSLSTDDRWLVFASKQKGNWDLFVMDLFHPETTIQVTDGTEDDWDPVFYADERVIVFASSNGNQPGIFALCTFGELTN
jgi:Tol biopolymer transport system component